MGRATGTRASASHSKVASLPTARSCLPGPPEQCLAIPWGQAMIRGPSLPDFHGTKRPSFVTSAEEQSLSLADQGLSGEAEQSWTVTRLAPSSS